MALIFRVTPAASEDAVRLIAALDADLHVRYPGEPVNGIDTTQFESGGGTFAVGYLNGEPVACGGLRPFDADIEVKRMFVVPQWRGRGFARKMLSFLEEVAKKRGFARAILETGIAQPEAIALYESCGWTRSAPYGHYEYDPRSVCFQKLLRDA